MRDFSKLKKIHYWSKVQCNKKFSTSIVTEIRANIESLLFHPMNLRSGTFRSFFFLIHSKTFSIVGFRGNPRTERSIVTLFIICKAGDKKKSISFIAGCQVTIVLAVHECSERICHKWKYKFRERCREKNGARFCFGFVFFFFFNAFFFSRSYFYRLFAIYSVSPAASCSIVSSRKARIRKRTHRDW